MKMKLALPAMILASLFAVVGCQKASKEGEAKEAEKAAEHADKAAEHADKAAEHAGKAAEGAEHSGHAE